MKNTQKEKVVKVNFGFYPSTLTQIRYLAEKRSRSVSNLLRVLVDQEYKQEKKKEPKTA